MMASTRASTVDGSVENDVALSPSSFRLDGATQPVVVSPQVAVERPRQGTLAQSLKLAILFVLAVGLSVLVASVLLYFRESVAQLGPWGYVGAFLAELGNSVAIIFPTPGPAYTFAMGATLNPFQVGLVGGVGAALGELSGYYLGLKGRHLIEDGPLYRRFEGLFHFLSARGDNPGFCNLAGAIRHSRNLGPERSGTRYGAFCRSSPSAR